MKIQRQKGGKKSQNCSSPPQCDVKVCNNIPKKEEENCAEWAQRRKWWMRGKCKMRREKEKSTRQEKKCWKSSLSIFDELSSSPEREWRARMPTAAAGKCVSFPKKMKVERVLASFSLRWHILHIVQSSSSGEEKSIVNLNISSLFFRSAFLFCYCEKGFFRSLILRRDFTSHKKIPTQIKVTMNCISQFVSPKSGSACDETRWRRRAHFSVR